MNRMERFAALVYLAVVLSPCRWSLAQLECKSGAKTLAQLYAWSEDFSPPSDPEVREYIKAAPAPELPPSQRLPYFVRHINSKNEEIWLDATYELELADLKHFTTMGPSEIAEFETFVETAFAAEPMAQFRLEKVLTVYLFAKGTPGLDFIEETIIRDERRAFEIVYAVIKALRTARAHELSTIDKERLKRSMRLMLDRPDIADLAIADLARWKDWEVVDKIKTIYDSAGPKEEWLRRTATGYFLACAESFPADQTSDVPRHVAAARRYLITIKSEKPQIYNRAVRHRLRTPQRVQQKGRFDARGEFSKTASGLSGLPIYTTAIHRVVFDPHTNAVVAGTGQGRVEWYDVDSGNRIQSFTAHVEWCFSIAFHPNGKQMATGGGDHLLRLWNLGNPEPIATIEEHSDDVHDVAFGPAGRMLYSSGDDTSVVAYDLETSKVVARMKGHTESVPSLAVSPDGKLIATGSRDDTIRIWNAKTGEIVHVLEEHEGDVHSVAFSPDGKLLASASYDETVRLWNVESGEAVRVLRGHENWVFSVAFSPDGRRLASGDKDGRVLIWNRASGEQTAALKRQPHVSCVAFSADGNLLATSSPEPSICVWDMETNALRNRITSPPP